MRGWTPWTTGLGILHAQTADKTGIDDRSRRHIRVDLFLHVAAARNDLDVRVYTTRCDTLFGVTYMVMSPEHPLIDKYKEDIKNWDEIAAYP